MRSFDPTGPWLTTDQHHRRMQTASPATRPPSEYSVHNNPKAGQIARGTVRSKSTGRTGPCTDAHFYTMLGRLPFPSRTAHQRHKSACWAAFPFRDGWAGKTGAAQTGPQEQAPSQREKYRWAGPPHRHNSDSATRKRRARGQTSHRRAAQESAAETGFAPGSNTHGAWH